MAKRHRRILARWRRNRLVAVLAGRAWKLVRAYRNFDYDPRYNGEAWLLERLSVFGPSCLFDVGANRGDWTALALEACPSATVHAFEPVPETAAQFAARFDGNRQVKLTAAGLAETSGVRDIACLAGHDTHASFVALADERVEKRLSVALTTGDAYLTERKIATVDLLKIDVEGAEHLVLRGFADALAKRAIASVQFEYGYASLMTRHLLADYYRDLEAAGFAVGKLYPNYVDFRPYRPEDEDFIGPNYVAVLRERDDLVAALRA